MLQRVKLGWDPKGARPRMRGPNGVVVGSDGALRVVYDDQLFAVDRDGKILWTLGLLALDGPDSLEHRALPVALADERTLLSLSLRFVVVDAGGKVVETLEPTWQLDDSGAPPALGAKGTLIATSPMGDITAWTGDKWRELGVFGYDIVPPALFDDGSMAVSGYSNKGFCRVGAGDEIVWEAPPRDVDRLATIQRDDRSAVASTNDHKSIIYDAKGQTIGEYPHAALFAEAPDAGWYAYSRGRLARLAPKGDVTWDVRLDPQADPGTSVGQPVVDAAGVVMVAMPGSVACFRPDGGKLFDLDFDTEAAGPLSIIDVGVAACVAGDELIVFE